MVCTIKVCSEFIIFSLLGITPQMYMKFFELHTDG